MIGKASRLSNNDHKSYLKPRLHETDGQAVRD